MFTAFSDAILVLLDEYITTDAKHDFRLRRP